MQDPDDPPVEEGETGGGVAVVRPTVAGTAQAGIASSMAASIPPLWITVTARHLAAMDPGQAATVPPSHLPPPRCSRRRKRYLVFLAATRHSIAEECFFLRACAPRWGLLVPSIPVATADSALRSSVRADGRQIGLLARRR